MHRRYFLQNSLFASSVLILPGTSAKSRAKKGIPTKDGTARNSEKIICAGAPVDFKLLSINTDALEG